MCLDSFASYGLRAIGIGERRLPSADIGLCDQIVLIGSGLIWNVYFVVVALSLGFFLAVGLAVMKASNNAWLRAPAALFVFIFRGSPLFIQFFFAYAIFSTLPRAGIELDLGLFTLTAETRWLARAWPSC